MGKKRLTTVAVVIFVLMGPGTAVTMNNTCHATSTLNSSVGNNAVLCSKLNQADIRRFVRRIKPRRYDIDDMGDPEYFHGWADVQGQGAANDYCRFVGSTTETMQLSCALAGTHGDSDLNYNSAKENFQPGFIGTWYMKDEDHDGRDDYCRCVGVDINLAFLVCTKAGPCGFYGSQEQPGQTFTFNRTSPLICNRLDGIFKMRPELGKPWSLPSSR